MLTIHKLHRDGTVTHSDFLIRQDWYDALRDPDVQVRWAHLPGDCEPPADKVRRTFQGLDTSLARVSRELAEAGLEVQGRAVEELRARDPILGSVVGEHKRKPKPKAEQLGLF